MSTLSERWRSVLDRVAEAARRAARDPAGITVVAAAKTFPAAVVAECVALGIRDIGENYVQEGAAKRAVLVGERVRWHLIGRLQRNKAGRAVDVFDRIHSLDSIALARVLDQGAAARGKRVSCLLQVNLGAERQKAGVEPEQLEELFVGCGELSHLSIEGLMTIPPPVERPEQSRSCFRRLRELRDRLVRLRLPDVHLKELSMGMSSDFEVAVEEGATFVRIGTALFGPRGAR